MTAEQGRVAVFICHADGRLVESVRDDFDLGIRYPEAQRLSQIFRLRSGLLDELLARMARSGLLFDPSSTLEELQGDTPLAVAGVRHLSYLYVVISDRRETAQSYFQRMMEDLHEQTDRFRRDIGGQVPKAPKEEPHGIRLFEEVSRLNNELVNTQRQLAKKVQELESAFEHVKQLEGLIPICANCKRIRNDQGYWEEVELYIQSHSGAKFSHGICDACKVELYPELFAKPADGG